MVSSKESLALFGVKRRTRRSLGSSGTLAVISTAAIAGIAALGITTYQASEGGKKAQPTSQDLRKNASLPTQVEESPAYARAYQKAQSLIADPRFSEWRRVDGNITSATIFVYETPLEADVVAERGVVTRTKPTPYSKSAPLWTWLHPTLHPTASWQMEVEIEMELLFGPGVKDVVRFAVLEDLIKIPPDGEKPLQKEDFPLFAAISKTFVDPSGKLDLSDNDLFYGTFLKPKENNLHDPIKISWPIV